MEPQLNQEIINTANAHEAIQTDAVIIGAGPVGLFQVFELGLLEIKAHVIDSLAYPGGQPIELYPDKPIYDIPAIPVCTGKELTDSLMKQIAPFGATFHLGQTVVQVQKQDDGRFYLETDKGTRFLTKTIFIAAGVGAFEPRLLKVDGLDEFKGTQLHYSVKDPAIFKDKNLIIVGGGDSALDWALNFAQGGQGSGGNASVPKAESVILIHRRDGFKAAPASVAKMKELCDAYEMQFMVGQVTDIVADHGKLKQVKVTGGDGVTRTVSLDMLLVFFGLSPKLGPIANWSLEIERKQLVVDTEKFSTNVPGIFAVGDINTYPGKKKLILSGFHECALAAFAAAAIIFPEKGKIHLQYTTTSPKLHKVLGVESPVFD